jgi:hypothetical protein
MSCQHGNWPPCDECDALDEKYEAGCKHAIHDAAEACRALGKTFPIDNRPFGYQYAEAIEKLTRREK